MYEINEDNFPKEWNLSIGNKRLRKAIFEAFKGKCFYSGRPLTLENMRIDHVIPLSKGGPNNIYNYVLCEEEINTQKTNNFDPIKVQPILYLVSSVYVQKVLKVYRRLLSIQQPRKKKVTKEKVKSISSQILSKFVDDLLGLTDDMKARIVLLEDYCTEGIPIRELCMDLLNHHYTDKIEPGTSRQCRIFSSCVYDRNKETIALEITPQTESFFREQHKEK